MGGDSRRAGDGFASTRSTSSLEGIWYPSSGLSVAVVTEREAVSVAADDEEALRPTTPGPSWSDCSAPPPRYLRRKVFLRRECACLCPCWRWLPAAPAKTGVSSLRDENLLEISMLVERCIGPRPPIAYDCDNLNVAMAMTAPRCKGFAILIIISWCYVWEKHRTQLVGFQREKSLAF